MNGRGAKTHERELGLNALPGLEDGELVEETESFISDVAGERPDRAIAGVRANEIDRFITNSKLAQRLAVRVTAPHG